ncbi:MAG TPA: ATP-binding protein [Caulobacteraceae bacterium]|jgi:signal transduction histidine kinase|nr:ATP-binding protein [Caulobacteraceae bacterium]
MTEPLPFDDVFQGGGEMGALMRAYDWAATPLGRPQDWPRSLQSIVRMMLTSRYQMWMAWGEDLTFFCNDAYSPTLGIKHPWALGQSARQVWAEIWPEIGPLIDHVLGSGEATYSEGMLLFLERSGFPEETYHTFSYSPLFDDAGVIAGMFCVVVEETDRVINERRLDTLRKLGSAMAVARTEAALFSAVEAELAQNLADLPFTLTYLFDEDRLAARLAACSGVAAGAAIAAPVLAEGGLFWPLAAAPRPGAPVVVADLARHFGDVPKGAWDKPPEKALLFPIAQPGQETAAGFLVVGLNPYRAAGKGYDGFVELLAGQIAGALASARAYEAERRRAEALAEIDRAKTAFFSNVSHEFRTPLTLMLGPLEEVLAGEATPEARGQIELAHRSGVRLLRLVNSLLDFSRIEAGRVRAAFVPTDFAAFNGEIASSFRSTMERAGLALVIRAEAVPDPVFLDREMWEKVLLNLLSNAFKFTFEGTVTVETGLSADGRSAQVSVSDTGIGVEADQLPRLFERFHRIEGARGRSFEGSGIGLALVQELVKLHGGDIAVDSTPGRGTRFMISLPLGPGHLPADQVRRRAPAAEPGHAAAMVEEAARWLPEGEILPETAPMAPMAEPGSRILLADDNADMRGYVRRLLEAQGYSVEAVGDGQAALDAARARTPDLILSDVMMPVLDGFGLLRAVRGDPALAGAPVVLLSARAGEEAKVEGLEAGADDYLIKPFAARELLARVAVNIRMARLRRDAAQREIDQRREAEAGLQALNARLEERVGAEVAERMKVEEALRQVQKMEAVGQLTGGVAHDFNNLLTVIIGGLDTVRRNAPTDNARLTRALDMATQGANRAATLTSRLLAFSRRQPLEPKPLDLNAVVRQSTELLHRTLGETIELEGVLASRLWLVEADQNQLESAILNLAVNARDAMRQGGKLTIETANTLLDESYAYTDAEVAPGQYAMLSISDSGSGMSRQVLERAFEPFYTTKEVGKGTGLGLSMVYGFAKQSGGHVTIYSEPGEGTTVKLYFPRYSGALAEHEAPVRLVAPESMNGETVLLVEDNDEVRTYSASVLNELGYQVIEAAHAEAGLEIIRRPGRIDLLFTDVVLPGRSGRQMADEARTIRPELKVLYTTGYSRNAIVHQGRLDAGVNLIGKPFTFEQLAQRLRDVLDG